MKFGYYADRELPVSVALDRSPLKDYKVNTHGYRCPEWDPMPDGKKNVVVLGCRILYGCEKIINPNIIIICWPFWSRREKLHQYAQSLMSHDEELKNENELSDKNNFLKNVFFVEKFAEKNGCKTFHCFAQDSYHEHIKELNVLEDYTIKNCWPYWDKFEQRVQYKEPNFAADGEHYGVYHHERFAQLFLEKFSHKLR